MTLTTNPGILNIDPYKGGDAGEDDTWLRLASNESALGASPEVLKAIENYNTSHRYPDGNAFDLRKALAEKNGLDMDGIVCGAGSDELISLAMRAFTQKDDEVLYSQHGFLMYPITAHAQGAKPVPVPEKNLKCDVEKILLSISNRTKVIFIANPNNPTGSYLNRDELKFLYEKIPSNVLLVLDTAYREYAEDIPDYDSGLSWVQETENVMVLSTFSKLYGLAGLRLGWGAMNPKLADILNRIRGPFNVSAIAQSAGIAALSDKTHVENTLKETKKALEIFTNGLNELRIKHYPSIANFVLMNVGDVDLWDKHLREHKILTRRMKAYGLPTCLRVTIGTVDQMKQVLECITKINV